MMNKTRFLTFPIILLATGLLTSPARSWPVRTGPVLLLTQNPTSTMKICHICGDDVASNSATPAPASIVATDKLTPVVRAVLFWMDGCPHCHGVLEEVLPPLQEKYGEQLDILLVELIGSTEVDALYKLAESLGIPNKQVKVPFLVIGEHVLIGSEQIPAELPGLIESYLTAGGVDYPQSAALAPLLPTQKAADEICNPSTPCLDLTPPITEQDEDTTEAIVQAILFTTPDCHDCQLEVRVSLTPIREKYGSQFEYRTIDIVTSEDVEYFYQVAKLYKVAQEDVELPLMIIGDRILIGDQMVNELPGLVESYFATGGVAYQDLPDKIETAPTPAPSAGHSNGFTLAVVITIGMVIALVYALVAFVTGKVFALPETIIRWLFPLLTLIGLGVALYLAYVETQSASAVCGPVGDCNAVQSSPYARLFGILPVGVLGALGYFAMLGVWIWNRLRRDWLAQNAPLALFAMTFFGTLISLYLTYLEPFVIKAVCIWCLTSAVIITLLLLISLTPALNIFIHAEKDI